MPQENMIKYKAIFSKSILMEIVDYKYCII